MTNLEEQINHIEQLDRLIRLRAAGKPNQMAERLGISEACLFRLLDCMKKMNAPLKYDIYLQSYVYEEEVSFEFGFFTKEDSPKQARKNNGGFGNMKLLADV